MMILLALTMPLIASGSQADGACTSQDAGPVHISLKTFGSSGTVRTSAILEEVDRIWAPYDVRFAWHVASPQGGAPRDAAPIDLWIQLLHDSAPASDTNGRALVLGKVRFDDGQPLRTVRIAADATRSVLRDAYANHGAKFNESFPPDTRVLERALARAIAHELGHILLRSAAHTPSGLMRAKVPAALLTTPDPVDLAVEPTLLAALRARLRANRETCDGLVTRR